MPYDPNRHHRRSIRLKGYDYTQPGAYFVTLVTYERMPLFGEIVNGEMRLNDIGRVAERCWLDIPSHFPHVALDAFVIMPNHVHGILWIIESPPGTAETERAKNFSPPSPPSPSPLSPPSPLPPPSPLSRIPSSTRPPSSSQPPPTEHPRGTSKTIGSVIRGFKIGVTQWVRQNTDIYIVWQRNYYDRIIRNERALNAIRQYIIENPRRWQMDRENEARTAPDPLAQAIWNMLKQEEADHSPGGEQ
jgi:putative transposase